jgi:hypothetical protein
MPLNFRGSRKICFNLKISISRSGSGTSFLYTTQTRNRSNIAMAILPNLVVVGGSYVGSSMPNQFNSLTQTNLPTLHVGVNTAAQLATAFHDRFRVVLIERNSHFQHLFAFPRFAVATGVDTHKAFIPFVPGAFAGCPPSSGIVVQASASGLKESAVQLDREVDFDGQQLRSIPYSYLVSLGQSTCVDLSQTNGSPRLSRRARN